MVGSELLVFALIFFGVVLLSRLTNKASAHQATKPCYMDGRKHEWEHKTEKNQFNEEIWYVKCKRCSRRAGTL